MVPSPEHMSPNDPDSDDIDIWKGVIADIEADEHIEAVTIGEGALDYIRETARMTGHTIRDEIMIALATRRQMVEKWQDGGEIIYRSNNGTLSSLQRDFAVEEKTKSKRRFFGPR